jgi:CubicO group peptidase (beta-lactamase class C family)
MSLGPKVHAIIASLVFALALATAPSGHAQRLSTENWGQWNAASIPIYPDETWQQYATPEEAGWSSEGLKSARKNSRVSGSAAVMVIYDGAILAQWGQVERRFMCHSIRKSLLSALYGIAVAKGEIDIDETLGSIGIDDDTGLTEIERSARVSDLLKSRSGVYLPAAYETPSRKNSRPARGSHDPGTHWYYNNWDFNVLATIYNKKTRADLIEAFRSNIAEPLMMRDFDPRHAYYHLEPDKSRHPAYPFRMSARDLARFGLLFLNDGEWDGTQIIPSEWVRDSTRSYSKTSVGGYGYMWWTVSGQLGELGVYAALGYGGHAIYVVPAARLVFVHRVDTYERKRVSHESIRLILKRILRARMGPPRADPALIDGPSSPPVEPGTDLTDGQRAALVGRYRVDDFVATVRVIDGRLEVEAPRRGRFYLLPRGPTAFQVEDDGVRVEFQLDGTSKATAMLVWFKPDEPYEMLRVP